MDIPPRIVICYPLCMTMIKLPCPGTNLLLACNPTTCIRLCGMLGLALLVQWVTSSKQRCTCVHVVADDSPLVWPPWHESTVGVQPNYMYPFMWYVWLGPTSTMSNLKQATVHFVADSLPLVCTSYTYTAYFLCVHKSKSPTILCTCRPWIEQCYLQHMQH